MSSAAIRRRRAIPASGRQDPLRLFVVSGIVAAIAGIVYAARLANSRADNALGMELDIIIIALLGGVSVFGGRGS